jgi:hypothetical protein
MSIVEKDGEIEDSALVEGGPLSFDAYWSAARETGRGIFIPFIAMRRCGGCRADFPALSRPLSAALEGKCPARLVCKERLDKSRKGQLDVLGFE